MEISLHVIKYDVNILVILCSDVIPLFYDILVFKLRQKNYLPEGSLCISGIVKGIENLFHCDDLLSLYVDCFPDYTICTLTKLLDYLVFL